MGAGRVSLDFKYVYSDVIKDDFSSGGGGNSKVEESAIRAEENEIFGLYISGNSSALFSLTLRLVTILDLGSSLD